jgi:hypothetical protein
MHPSHASLASILLLGLLLACAAPAPTPSRNHTPVISPPDNPPGTNKSAFQPFLRLSPTEASTAPGGEVRFSASINYDPAGPRYIRQPVTFRVEEAEGGTAGPAGLYTAPTRPGVYHVVARRDDFPEVQARATVTVLAR